MRTLVSASASEIFRDAQRTKRERKTFWLVRKSQSNWEKSRSAASRGAKSSGGAKLINGRRMGVAPRACRLLQSDSHCSAARVTTTRLPVSDEEVRLLTLPSDFFENIPGARLDQEPSHVLTKLRGLIRRRGGALLDVLHAIDGADTGFEDKFTAFDARPSTERHLAASVKRSKKSALANDGSARFRVVQYCESVGHLRIFQASLNDDGALPDRGHAYVGRKRFTYALAPAEAVETCFRKQDGVIFAAGDFAQARVYIATQFAKVEIGTDVENLGLAAEAAGAHAGDLAKIRKRGAVRRNKAIADVVAAKHGGKAESRGRVARNVLQAVNGNVD